VTESPKKERNGDVYLTRSLLKTNLPVNSCSKEGNSAATRSCERFYFRRYVSFVRFRTRKTQEVIEKRIQVEGERFLPQDTFSCSIKALQILPKPRATIIMEFLRVNPRSKDVRRSQPGQVLLTAECLQEHFVLPLNEAAKKLGVGATSLKIACRKAGISHWPYRKVF
jgi:hypothetical protein